MYTKAFIPYGGYYSSPFAKWQGTLANDNALILGAATFKRWLAMKGWDASVFDYTYQGQTVVQNRCFCGAPWINAMIGNDRAPGITIMQVCATSTSSLNMAAMGLEMGLHQAPLCFMADRMSNSPHLVWANPNGPGGQPVHEDWVMDNFSGDPLTKITAVMTAENVAKKFGFTKEQADEMTLCRFEQYQDALKDDRAFQKRYMFPVEIQISRKKTIMLEADEGIPPTTLEAVTKMKPVLPDGIHSSAAQTHPADGNACMLVTTKDNAQRLSADPSKTIQLVSYGFTRVEPGYMPMAPVPASKMALERAGIKMSDVKVIKSHNPFAANDLYFVKEMGIDMRAMNNYGSSIIFGHPQSPTVLRLAMEGIEEAVIKGGGYVLITGCAGGNMGASLVFKVS